jgi:alkanesulfonate monooxygenase SsuD/methylene tetrahydromethanopterin reductase-like flavin-dependent oxidoreductase (luciferase family)
VRFGLHTGQHHVPFEELAGLWSDAEAWGFDACYVFDHFVPLHSDVEAFLPEEHPDPEGPCLEGLSTLAALARRVPRIGVGIMVAAVGYRNAGLFAHAAATLDRIAPGRLEVGIGGGWLEREYRAFGLRFPAARERMEELERALASWPGHGRLWVAGTGERRLIPLAARYADAWNAMYLTSVEFGAKVATLLAHRGARPIERSIALRAFCSRNGDAARAALEVWARGRGRDPARALERSLVGTPDECEEQVARYAQAGATHVAVMAHPPYDREGLALLARDVFPRFR